MRQSNGYIIGFSAALTIVLGGLLALAATLLKEPQGIQKELDKKKQILGAVMSNVPQGEEAIAFYEQNIVSVVIDANGNEIEGVKAEDINIRKEYKKTDAASKRLPVYKFKSRVHEGQVEAYILPVYGNGLWDEIWGYIALSSDYNTLKGVVFDHKAETPGLGARITDKEIQQRFKGKKIYGKSGELTSVSFVKGEGNPIAADNYSEVDGLSGATMTTKGVNAMLESYFTLYAPYIEKSKNSNVTTAHSNVQIDYFNNKSSDRFIQQ